MLRYQGVSASLRALLGGILLLFASTALAQQPSLAGFSGDGVTCTGTSCEVEARSQSSMTEVVFSWTGATTDGVYSIYVSDDMGDLDKNAAIVTGADFYMCANNTCSWATNAAASSGVFLRNAGTYYLSLTLTPTGSSEGSESNPHSPITLTVAAPANSPPTAGDRPDGLTLTVRQTGGNLRVVEFVDMGDSVTCTATSDLPTVATVTAPSENLPVQGNIHRCPVTVSAVSVGEATITVTASDSAMQTVTQTFVVTVNAATAAPAAPAESSSSSGGIVVLAIAAAGGYYYWWKQQQIANGNAAAMALLPDVSFDLDRSDRRAFYTKMNWQNRASSNWQIRSNLALHAKYDGELLDWNANSHIGYKLRGKFGEFNPYMNAKFVANDPQNAEMQQRYSLGLNYAIPNRFAIQLVQPDSDLENYALGIQWRGKSKIRYSLQNETSRNSYRFSGQFSF